MNSLPNDYPVKLERTIHALNGINHGICAAVENECGITPTQIYCMLELVSSALSESLADLVDS